MTEHSDAANSTGIAMAAVGTAIGDFWVQFGGLLVTLLVAYWNSRAKQGANHRAGLELRHERDRSDFYLRKCARQEAELARLRVLPVSVTPPFPVGEACSDA